MKKEDIEKFVSEIINVQTMLNNIETQKYNISFYDDYINIRFINKKGEHLKITIRPFRDEIKIETIHTTFDENGGIIKDFIGTETYQELRWEIYNFNRRK